MRLRTIVKLLFVATQIASTVATAQEVTAVKPIPGYKCMNLAISHDQVVDPNFEVPVYRDPSPNSPKIGVATVIPFIREPFRPNQQFQQMLRLNGEVGWIETKWLIPFFSPSHPKAVCSPWVMSNGRIGARTNTPP
jgi:hypothetical protein